MARALLLSDHYQSALACVASLGRAGHEVIIFGGAAPSPAAASTFVTRIVTPVAAVNTTEARARSLIAFIRSEAIDVVIPQSDYDALVVATARELAPEIAALVAPAVASVAVARDKIRTLAFARETGLATPESVVVADKRAIAEEGASLGRPLVVKAPVSTASSGTFVVTRPNELAGILPRLPSGEILLQRFVRGDRVGATGFAVDGELVGWFGFKVLSDGGAGGTPVYALSDPDPNLGAMLSAICRGLNWSGGIDIDAMRGADGTVFLLEINPRFSGTLVFADKVGLDLVSCYVDVALGRRPSAPAMDDKLVLFISRIPHEVAMIAADGRAGLKRAADMRRRYRYVDNQYPDDGRLTLAQLEEALSIALGARLG